MSLKVCGLGIQKWGVVRGSSISWVAKFKGDKIQNGSCQMGVVAKLQGDKSASQSSMELYYPWISGPLRNS